MDFSLQSFCPDPCCPVRHLKSDVTMRSCAHHPENPCIKYLPATNKNKDCLLDERPVADSRRYGISDAQLIYSRPTACILVCWLSLWRQLIKFNILGFDHHHCKLYTINNVNYYYVGNLSPISEPICKYVNFMIYRTLTLYPSCIIVGTRLVVVVNGDTSGIPDSLLVLTQMNAYLKQILATEILRRATIWTYVYNEQQFCSKL